MDQDLGEIIKANPQALRLLEIRRAEMSYLRVRLQVLTTCWFPQRQRDTLIFEIDCSKAVDYCIRPKNPACIEGGPLIEFYESHPLLENEKLELVPGGDGDVFTPPLKLKLLMLDQSHVIAERFAINEPKLSSLAS